MVVNEAVEGVPGGVLTHPGVAAAWGGAVLILIYALGDLSGAHFNPAVSWGFVIARRFPARDALAYSLTQIAAAILAALSLRGVLGNQTHLGATETVLPPAAAWLVECFLTLLLMVVILGVSTGAKEKSITAGLAVGLTIGLEALVAGPLTNASMNPARSIGPAIAASFYDQLWVYVTAPLVGAAIGVGVYAGLSTRTAAAEDSSDH